ncbi:hypothetical protein [Roseimaritima ulvae]|nr:hypothetical protein [Roseimaritima ulvae]
METALDTHVDELKERFPEELVDRSWRNYVLAVGIPCGMFCCFPIALAAFDSSIDVHGPARWFAAAFLSVLFLCFGSLILFSSASILHRRLKANLPTVRLRVTELTLECGNVSVTADIRQCRVRRGRACSMRIAAVPMGIKMYCWFPVILIHMPPFERAIAGVYYSHNVVPVGYDKQSLKRWEQALLPLVGEPSNRDSARPAVAPSHDT